MIRYAHADESADVLLARVGYSAPVPSSAGVVFVAEAEGVTVGVLVGVLDGVGPCAPVPRMCSRLRLLPGIVGGASAGCCSTGS